MEKGFCNVNKGFDAEMESFPAGVPSIDSVEANGIYLVKLYITIFDHE